MKMDKREIILCLLFACLFITMIFIRAFAVVAAEPVNVTTLPHHGKQSALEILEDDTSYNNWLDDLRDAGAEVASNVWTTAEDMARNLLAYGVGCVANVTEEVLQVAFPDLEHYLGDMYFDWDSLEWEFTTPDDVEEFIATGLEPYAFDIPSGVIGNWVPIPCTVHIGPGAPSSWVGIANTYRNIGDVTCYLAAYMSGSTYCWAVAYKGQEQPGNDFGYSFAGSPSFNCSFFYQGSFDSGYYYNTGGYSYSDLTYYSTLEDALADFFGHDISTDPVPTGDVLYFDNPQLQPLSYYPSTGIDFTSIVNEGQTNNYDYSVVNNYNTYYPTTYSFDIPYWLKVPTTTPKIYDLPSDYDYGNIQFDYEADSSFLDGAGLVQDVYEILPSQLQNLIILFGAGTCAFIFLRR